MITWLASYPRSGNTFLRIILNRVFNIKTFSVYNDLKDIESHVKTKEIVGHVLLPKDFNFEEASKSDDDYFIKTHRLPTPTNRSEKVIYLIRDGRDCITSYYHYRNEYNNAPPVIDFIEGKTRVGSWSEHVNNWTTIDKDKLLLITFDELISGQALIIQKISNFIRRNPINSALPSFLELNQMNPKFFKTGKNQTYKELFSEYDHQLFWEFHHAQMTRFGFTHNIPDGYIKDSF